MSFSTFGEKSIYGFSKFASEELIREFSYLYNIDYIINRCGVVAGPWQFGKVDQGFFALWIWKHINKKKLNYIGFGGYGNQIRDILHIEDLNELIYKQITNIKKIKNKSFSVGGSSANAISLKKLTKICQKITNNKIEINSIKKTSVYDIPYFVSSNKHVSNTYRWKPKKNLITIAKDIQNWQINNFKLLKNILD